MGVLACSVGSPVARRPCAWSPVRTANPLRFTLSLSNGGTAAIDRYLVCVCSAGRAGDIRH
eukprot:5906802-Pleurochrysis_carterae.AAC.1